MNSPALIRRMRDELRVDPSGRKLEALIRAEKERGLDRQQAFECLFSLLQELSSIEPEADLTRQMIESVQDVLDFVTAAGSNSDFWIYPRDSDWLNEMLRRRSADSE